MQAPSGELERRIRAAVGAFQGRDFARAIAEANAALAVDAANYDAMHVIALALLNSGRAPEALERADALVAAYPADPFVRNTRGAVLQVLGRMPEAAEAYRSATAIAPDYAEAWMNLGVVLLAGGDEDGAEVALATSAEKHPGVLPRVGETLGRLRLRTAHRILGGKDRDDALAPASEAARLLPRSPDAVGAEGLALLHRCELEAALERFDRAATLAPDEPRWRFVRALAWPAVMESKAQIAWRLAEVSRDLSALARDPPQVGDPARDIVMNGLFMAYQGFDDTRLQCDIAEAYRRACPILEWSSPHLAPGRPAGRKIRLGMVSAYLNDHTIGKLNLGFARHLDKSRFELVILRPQGTGGGTLARFFDESADRVVELPLDIAAAREAVAGARLDALFYPEVGLAPLVYFLAFARLAPVQFTTWGHPVTTGMPNMDYFLSSRKVEPADGERRYREKLVLFDALPSFYYRPRDPADADMRARLGIGRDERLYVCPQTLIKFHPDFDEAVVAILRGDGKGVLVLIDSPNPSWNRKLQARMAKAGPDVASRIRFVPPMPMPEFFALQRQADCLLDTFHFGGGCSSYEALGASAPVVTLPGDAMRARVTLGWYEALGEPGWVARDPAHFVELAHRLANDVDAREASRRRIAKALPALVENQAVVRELERFVEGAVEAAR